MGCEQPCFPGKAGVPLRTVVITGGSRGIGAAAVALFAGLGDRVFFLYEKNHAAASAVAGCGPAFVAMMLEALADAGVKYGLPRATAYRLASQTAVGAGRM